jgi:hypothetical protein
MTERTQEYAVLAAGTYQDLVIGDAVQGEANSPFKKFAEVPTEVGIATSLEQSSRDWQQAAAQNTAQEPNVSHAIASPSQTEASPAHSPHSLSR